MLVSAESVKETTATRSEMGLNHRFWFGGFHFGDRYRLTVVFLTSTVTA